MELAERLPILSLMEKDSKVFSIPLLPVELLEKIIGCLPVNRPDDLVSYDAFNNCALVSSTFRHICQRRVYGIVTLGLTDQIPPSFRPHRFISLIEDTPQIADYVIELQIQHFFTSPAGDDCVDEALYIIDILSRLRNMTILTLGRKDGSTRLYSDWKPALREAIITKLLSLNELNLFNMSGLSNRLWVDSPTLRRIQFINCTFSTADEPTESIQLKVRELHFDSSIEGTDHWNSFVEWTGRHSWVLQSDSLTSLAIIVYYHLFDHISDRFAAAQKLSEILRARLPSLEFLHVYLPPPSDLIFHSGPDFLDFTPASNLRTLYLTFHLWGAHHVPSVRYNNIPWFTSIISTIPHRSHVKRIVFICSIIDYSRDDEDEDQDIHCFPKDDWMKFQEVIQRLAESIDMCVALRVFRYTKNPRTIPNLSSMLELAISAGIVEIDEESMD